MRRENIISEPAETSQSVIHGMCRSRNVIFFTHNFVSTKMENEIEVALCLLLRMYLINQGYKPEEILIMCTTDEQTTLVLNMVNTEKKLPDSSSDKLQDDTNKNYEILILSAVVHKSDTSEDELPNHVFETLYQKLEQALLRSRSVYVFGHFSLASLTGPFERFCKLLAQEDSIRNIKELQPLASALLQEPQDNNLCLQERPCGHPCPRKMHPFDPTHDLPGIVCMNLCGRSCPRGHPCLDSCHAICKPCEEVVKLELTCGHSFEDKCVLVPKDPLCEIGIHVTLPCGHEADVQCGRASQHKCPIMCLRKIEKCGHTCRKQCYESCDPCQVWINHTIEKCGHRRFGQCWQVNTEICQEMVRLNEYDCGHSILIPCFEQGNCTSSELSRIFCKEPCLCSTPSKEERGCGHPCVDGSCEKCFGGVYHVRCDKIPCGRQLVCGHICCRGCPEDCPPCGEVCRTSCEHGKCRYDLCGIPCTPCDKPCKWECPHHKCTRKCKQVCSRPPCDLNCPNLLLCGHSCVCFCGEPCSPLCRICDHDTLLGGVFSGEDKIMDSDRFIYLVDCGHTIELESLAQWMQIEENDGEINPKTCPLCRQIIWTCRRFNEIVLKNRNEVVRVKTKIFGDPKENALQLKIVLSNLVKKQCNTGVFDLEPFSFKQFRMFLMNLIESKLEHGDRAYVPRLIVESIQSLANIYAEAVETSKKLEGQKGEFGEILKKYYDRLFHITSACRLPLTSGERADVLRETTRIEDLKILIDLHPSILPTTLKNLFRKPQVKVLHKEAFDSLTKPGPYDLDMHYYVAQLLEDLSASLKTTIAVSEKERIEILGAFGSRSGRWFKCPNGHVYVITECGGAMETGICPDCKAEVGGDNHQLLEDNNLATDMDGAIEPLYPTALLRVRPERDRNVGAQT